MAEDRQPEADARRQHLILLATGGAYFFALQFSFALPAQAELMSIIWPGSGIGLAGLLLLPRDRWRLLLLLLYLIGIGCNLWAGRPPAAALGFMLANVVESWACATFLRELFGEPIRFRRLREVVGLIAAATLVNGCTALLGAMIAQLTGGAAFWHFFRTWVTGDSLGIMLITPFVLNWVGEPVRRPRPPLRYVEAMAMQVLGVAITFLAFDATDSHWGVIVRPTLPPVLIAWAALRFGLRGTVNLLTVMSVTAVLTTLEYGNSPLGGVSVREQLTWVQLYLACITATGLLLSGAFDERAHTQSVLRQSRSLLEAIVEGTTDAVYIKDLQGRYLRTNRAAASFVGRRPEDLIGKDDRALFPPEEAQVVMADDHSVTEQAQTRTWEELVTTADGLGHSFHSTKGPLFDPEGRVMGLFGISRDVTAQREQERALQRSEARFRSIYEANVIGIAYWRLDGQIDDANDAYLAMTGYSRSDLRSGMINWRRLIAAEHLARATAVIDTLSQGGAAEPISLEILRKDGTRAQLLIAGAMLTGSKVFAGIAYVVDVTAQQQAEANRRQLEEQVRHNQKLESLGVLAGGIAHDFNNLLQPIIGYADLLLQGLAEGSQDRTDALAIRQAATRAAALTSQMLAYSGRGSPRLDTVDLNACLQQVNNLLESSIPAKHQLQFELAQHLPGVAADPSQLQQVALNLIVNASEAIDAHQGGLVRVATGVQQFDASLLARSRSPERPPPGRFVYLEVTDTGCGMDSHTLEHLFDPFFSTKFTGRGLGMAVVQGIVRGHKGAILVDSAVGKGTRVTVLFPVAQQDVAGTEPAPRPGSVVQRRLGRILLAEDDAAVRAVSTNMLALLGYEVHAAEDGTQAVAALRAEPGAFLAVVLDLSMPGLDGAEVLGEMRRMRIGCPVLLTSGYTEKDLSERFDFGPGVVFLSKPYSLEQLDQRLTQALG